MNVLKGKSRMSVFRMFLLSYVLVLAVPLLLGIVSHISAAHVVEKESISYNLAILEQAEQSIDMQFQAIKQIVTDISLNPLIQSFMYKTEPRSEDDIYRMGETIKEISRYSVINSLVDQVYIYFKKSNIILTHAAKYPIDIFYDKAIPYPKPSFEQWEEAIKDYHDKDFLLAYEFAASRGGLNQV